MAAVDSQLPPSPQEVGEAFVKQYYQVLHQSPGLLHQFYQDSSMLSRTETNGPTSLTTTIEAIKEKILSFTSNNFILKIKSYDAQASFYKGVHVLVTGSLKWEDKTDQYFTQSFFLAPQEKGYFVLNDILRFMGDTYDDINLKNNPAKDVESLPTLEQNNLPVQETLVPEETTEKKVLVDDLIKPSDVEQATVAKEEELPVPEVVNEEPDESSLVAMPTSKIVDVPKKTYASIVMMMRQNAKSFSSPAPVPRKPVPVKKSQEQVNPVQVSEPLTETPVVVSDSKEIAKIPEGEADGCSVYIKGLPSNVTVPQLEEEFKKFGTIKSGGIQIKNNKGFCYGFVEFEVASTVQQAIKASPIVIGGRQVRIDEKKSTISRGSNRDRFSNGRGNGFRSEGNRGRGYYGSGRGRYNRNDSNGRSEFVNRSGNRGGLNQSSNGERPNEDGFVPVKGTATSSTPRVTVTA